MRVLVLFLIVASVVFADQVPSKKSKRGLAGPAEGFLGGYPSGVGAVPVGYAAAGPIHEQVVVQKEFAYGIPQPYAVPIDRPYPVEVRIPYAVPVDRHVPVPYPVIKHVPVPYKVPVRVPYIVEKRIPVHHYIEKSVPIIIRQKTGWKSHGWD